jgi:hypothetical protein
MKVRLGEAIKCIGLLAIGFGIARWAILDQDRRHPLRIAMGGGLMTDLTDQSIWLLIVYNVRAILGGVVIVFGLTTCFERASRRPPRGWGMGRWLMASWSVALIAGLGYSSLRGEIFAYRRSWSRLTFDEFAGSASSTVISGVASHGVLCFLAGGFAAWLAGWPRDPSPDFVEWVGRTVLALMVLTTLVYDCVY